MLDYRVLTFLALYDEMNYRKTAEKLNMTQPGVTQHIHFLEHYYGIKLFEYDGRILSKTKNLPQKLVLQPMKNPDKVRVTAVKLGYRIESDSVFFSGDKYYDLMVLSKGKDCLTADEIEFGRTNILSPSEDFKRLINERLQIIEDCLKKDNLSDRAKEELTAKAEKLKNYV